MQMIQIEKNNCHEQQSKIQLTDFQFIIAFSCCELMTTPSSYYFFKNIKNGAHNS